MISILLGNRTTFQTEGKSRSSQSRRSAGIVSAVLLVAILILALLGNSQIILVISLYVCILLEGISLSVFVMYSKPEEDPFPKDSHRDHEGVKGNDVVNSMNIYVKYASRGSDHSRREIAHVIKNVMEDDASKKYRELSNDRLFQSDLERVVIPFTSGGAQTLGRRAPKTRVSRQEREAYLTSLERIVRKLGEK